MEKILSPTNIDKLLQQITTNHGLQTRLLSEKMTLKKLFENFTIRWDDAYLRFGQNPTGELAYRDIILYFTEHISPILRKYLSKGDTDQQAMIAIELMLFPAHSKQKIARYRRTLQRQKVLPTSFECPHFDRPIFIVSAPRAGSTLLFESLSKFEDIWSIGRESHDIETDIAYLHPATQDYKSNRLTHAPLEVATEVKQWFGRQLKNKDNQFYFNVKNAPSTLRFLEKTPKNSLRIPFLKQIFPQALFIFLYRDPLENISSLLEGWRSNRFLTYRNMPDWPYKEWHFLLPPDWKTMADSTLVDIAAYQWRMANQYILNDLSLLPQHDWCFITYHNLVKKPAETIHKISDFSGLLWSDRLEETFSTSLPLSSMVISPPMIDKWRKNEVELIPVLDSLIPLIKQVNTLKG